MVQFKLQLHEGMVGLTSPNNFSHSSCKRSQQSWNQSLQSLEPFNRKIWLLKCVLVHFSGASFLHRRFGDSRSQQIAVATVVKQEWKRKKFFTWKLKILKSKIYCCNLTLIKDDFTIRKSKIVGFSQRSVWTRKGGKFELFCSFWPKRYKKHTQSSNYSFYHDSDVLFYDVTDSQLWDSIHVALNTQNVQCMWGLPSPHVGQG